MATAPNGAKVVRGPLDEEPASGGDTDDWRSVAEIAILAGTATMLLWKVLGGVLPLYLHPRYTWLVVASAVALLIAAGGRAWQWQAGTTTPVRRGGMVLLALPIALGLLVPSQPLTWGDAAQAAPGPVETPRSVPPPTGDSREWNIYQWRIALQATETAPADLWGSEVAVIGFVRHNPRYEFDGFFVARYLIVHCVVDAVGISLPVIWPGGAALAPDGWVRVHGRLGTVTLNGQDYPAVVADTVESVSQPDDPYLYR